MKIVRGSKLDQIPASHEDKNYPGCLKKVLVKKNDLIKGRVQMINWSTLLPNKSFKLHYHEDMQEIFIILSGKVEVQNSKLKGQNHNLKLKGEKEENQKAILNFGDMVIIDEMEIHEMKNLTDKNVDYIAIGVARGIGGKTVNV